MNKLLQIPKKLFVFCVLLILAKHNYAINYIEIPKNNAVVSGDNVLVAWNRINSFTNYELSVSSSATFTSFTKYTATTTSFSIPATGLTSGTVYYLRIRGFAGNVKTGWSSVVNFTYFNPAADPNLKIWLKADKGVILSAGKVATWQDQSPNLNHANQPNVIQQPTVVNEPLLNNKPSIKLDGDDDYLVFNDIPNIRSVFLLLKHDSGIGSYQSILGGDPSYDFLGEDGTPLFNAGAPVLSKIISCNLNKTGVAANQLIKPTKYILLDIATTANVDADHIASDRKVYPGRRWYGRYAEVLLFSDTSEARRTLIQNYLLNKYAPAVTLKDTVVNVNFCDNATISAPNIYTNYTWFNGLTSLSTSVVANNTYSLKTKDIFGFESTDEIAVYPYVRLNNMNVYMCSTDTFKLDLKTPPGFTAIWNTGATTTAINITQPSRYTVRITDNRGCTIDDTVNILIDNPTLSKPVISGVLTACLNEKVEVKSITSVDSVLWSTGNTSIIFPVLTSGPYSVYAQTSTGCVLNQAFTLDIAGKAPTADFFITSTLCQSAPIGFSDSSIPPIGTTDNITTWKWNFSNGNTSTTTNATNVFNTFGSASASLKVTTNRGCSDSIFKSFNIFKKPVASFETRLSCSGNPTQFVDKSRIGNANITTYNWLFGNNPTAFFAQNPQYEFPDQGTYPVLLKVSDENGCTDTLTQNILVNPSPVSNFSFDSACGRTPVNFKFLASVQSPFTLLENFTWSFGDGNEKRAIYDPNNSYTNPGVYSVSLAVQASNQCVDTATKQIRVFDFPIVDFTVSPTQCVNKEIQFTDISSTPDGTPINDWKWYFSGQSTSTEQNPRYAFNAQGNYTVQLTAKNLVGCVGTKLRSIAVSQAPVPQFTFTPQNGLPPLCVTYNNQSATNGNYIWNYGDNSPSISGYNPPQHCYNSVGNYPITLVSTDFRGCTDTARKFILVDRVILDGAMVSLIITPNGDFYKVQANIVNNSNVEITALGLNLQLGGGSVIRENWTGSLLPGQATTYQFNGEIKLSESNQIPVICASIDNVNNFSPENRTDNNSTCKEVKVGQFDVLNLYPNPAYETLNFGVMLPEDGKVTIGFITTLGQLEYQLTFNGLKGYNTFSSSTIPLNAAVYVAEIMYDGQVIRKKFMRKDRK